MLLQILTLLKYLTCYSYTVEYLLNQTYFAIKRGGLFFL